MALLRHPFAVQCLPLNAGNAPSTYKGTILKFQTSPSTVALFGLKSPPYKLDALEPHMSQRTLEFHWGKHHRGYVDNLKKQIEGTRLEGYTLEELIKVTYNNGNPLPAFNNAAQVWNHDFFWESMEPGGGKESTGEILELIKKDFGSFDKFSEEFKQAASTQFGSGWAWLLLKNKKLVVEKSSNALNPLIQGHIPLLTIDVWEHAYYLDHQNRRPEYASVFLKELVSWDAVNDRLGRAKAFVNLGEPKIPEL